MSNVTIARHHMTCIYKHRAAQPHDLLLISQAAMTSGWQVMRTLPGCVGYSCASVSERRSYTTRSGTSGGQKTGMRTLWQWQS